MLVDLAKALSGEVQLSSRLGQWILAVSSLLDGVVDIKFPQIRLGNPADAAHYPTLVEAGPTMGWLFAIGNWCYAESPLLPNRDVSQNVIVGVSWAPAGNEPTKRVKWQGDFGFEAAGTNVDLIDATKTVEAAQTGLAAIYQRSALILTPADLAAFPGADDLHLRLQRVASSSDPVLPPGLHHVAVIQALV